MIDWSNIYEQIAPDAFQQDFFTEKSYYQFTEYGIACLVLSFIIFRFFIKLNKIRYLQYIVYLFLLIMTIFPFFYHKVDKLEIKLMVANGVFTGAPLCVEPPKEYDDIQLYGCFYTFFSDSLFQVSENGLKLQEVEANIGIATHFLNNIFERKIREIKGNEMIGKEYIRIEKIYDSLRKVNNSILADSILESAPLQIRHTYLKYNQKFQIFLIQTSNHKEIPLLIFNDRNELIYRNKDIIKKEIKLKPIPNEVL